jgi:hypothetical protein
MMFVAMRPAAVQLEIGSCANGTASENRDTDIFVVIKIKIYDDSQESKEPTSINISPAGNIPGRAYFKCMKRHSSI